MYLFKNAISKLLILGFVFSTLNVADGQQIGVFTPFTTVGDSFYENFGVRFGFTLPGGSGNGSRIVGLGSNGQFLPNIMFTQGSAGSTVPAFGGYDPNASLRTGFGVISPGGGGFTLGLEMGQGSTRSITSTTPGVVVPNGFGGSISNGSVSPFVTGVIPVVGDGMSRAIYPPDNAVTRGIQSGQLDLETRSRSEETETAGLSGSTPRESSATTSDISVAEIKAKKLRQKEAIRSEVQRLIAAAADYEKNSDFPKAKKSLRAAIKLIDDARLKQQLDQKLNELRKKR